MSISAKTVNELRKMTGAGMMDCKKALTESKGDFNTAIDILRKKGQKVSASRADREAAEGAVFVNTSEDNSKGIILTLNCETDFVGKNEEFLNLGNAILNLCFTENPNSIEDLLKLNLNDSSRTVEEHISEMIGKIGEKIEIGDFAKLSGEVVVPYVHAGNKLGVLVSLQKAGSTDVYEAGKNVGMQIAAMNPVAVNKEGVDAATVKKEIEIGREQALAEGKPQAIIDKIAEGKLQKFFKDNTLLNQQYVKDNSVTVSKYLDSVKKDLTVVAFKRIVIG